MKTMLWYLSGPMTGIPQFNFPAFERAAKELREIGYDVTSPHELDSKENQQMAWNSPDGVDTGQGESWGTCLARDIKLIADSVDGIIFLPGWENSKGARMEASMAIIKSLPFRVYSATQYLTEISSQEVRARAWPVAGH